MPAKTKAVKAVWNPGTQREEDETTGRATAVKLTKAQLDELERLAQEPQPSQGKGRVRVHNNLRRHGLASIGYRYGGFVCSITQAGREFLRTRGET